MYINMFTDLSPQSYSLDIEQVTVMVMMLVVRGKLDANERRRVCVGVCAICGGV